MAITKTKKCGYCKLELPISAFHKSPTHKGGYMWSCKKCNNKKRTIRRRRNPDLLKNEKLRETFGITLDDYKEILLKQNGVCAICGRPETSTYKGKLRHLSVDHDHKTDKVRGLLCNDCNVALGWFRDDIKVLQDAAKYLTLHKM